MKYEKDSQLSYSLGAFPTFELLLNKPNDVVCVYYHEKTTFSQDITKIKNYCENNNIPFKQNSKIINSIAKKDNVFIMAEFKKFSDNLDNGNQIVLVNPSDMGNAGTIMRTSLGFGYKNLVLITPCIDVFNPKVIRSSMGAIFSLNIKHYPSFEEYAKHNDIKKYLFMLDGKNILQDIDIKENENHALIFGNEATGLDDSLKKYGDTVLIKHSNKIDSLNLSISIGIAIYDFSKKNIKNA